MGICCCPIRASRFAAGCSVEAEVQVQPRPLSLGIVFPPLRFYEAAVTGRANSKRPESTEESWAAAAGAWSCNTAVPPPLLC